MTHNSHRTAISRQTLSTPAAYLSEHNLLNGRVLDYGCGRGGDVTRLGAQVEGYDPYYFPKFPEGQFDTVMCNFVLNVIPLQEDRDVVIETIKGYLKLDGVAYISVRNDKRELKGVTAKGTWQGYIELSYEVVKKTGEYVMYKLTK